MGRFADAYTKHGAAVVGGLLHDVTANYGLAGDLANLRRIKQARTDMPFRERLWKGHITPTDEQVYIRPLFEAFARTTDPSAGKASAWKYLEWICAAYRHSHDTGKPIEAEDFYKIKDDLKDLEAFQKILPVPQRDIHYYTNYQDLRDTLQPYQKKRDARKIAGMRESAHIMAESTVVYSGPEGRVVVPHTWRASRFWAQQTSWCIANSEDDHFTRYNNYAPIYIYMPRPSAAEKRSLTELSSFNYCGTNDKFYDELNQQISYSIPCLQKLFSAAARHTDTAANKRHFFRHGSFAHLTEWVMNDQCEIDDRAHLLEIVSRWPIAYAFATDALKNDKEVILRTARGRGNAYKFIPEKAYEDPEIAQAVALGRKADAIETSLRKHFTKATIAGIFIMTAAGGAIGWATGQDSYESLTRTFIGMTWTLLGMGLGTMVGSAAIMSTGQRPLSFLAENFARVSIRKNGPKQKNTPPQPPPAP